MIEGVANITGNINNDIQKLLGTLNKNGGPAPKVNEIDKIPRYNFAMPGSGNMPPVDIMFTPVNNNQLHFRINLVPRGGMSQNIIGSSQQNVKILETVPAQEQAFVFAGNVEKFAALPVWQGAQGQNVQSYLSQIKSLCVYGNVQARYLIINADIILKDPASAGKIIQLIEGFKNTLAKVAQFDIPPRIVSKGKFINVSGCVNIAKAWLMISRMTSQPRIKNSPARK